MYPIRCASVVTPIRLQGVAFGSLSHWVNIYVKGQFWLDIELSGLKSLEIESGQIGVTEDLEALREYKNYGSYQ